MVLNKILGKEAKKASCFVCGKEDDKVSMFEVFFTSDPSPSYMCDECEKNLGGDYESV